MKIKIFCFIAAVILLACSAYAHDTSISSSKIWIANNTLELDYITDIQNADFLYPKAVQVDDIVEEYYFYVMERILVTDSGRKCLPSPALSQYEKETNSIHYNIKYMCPGIIKNVTFSYDMLFDSIDSHQNLATFYLEGKEVAVIFRSDFREFNVPVEQLLSQWGIEQPVEEKNKKLWETARNFFILGVEHILTGYDHILFLLGLLLVVAYFRNLVLVVTAFTVAHSITLIASAMDVFVLPSKFTESLIALSIAYIGLENLYILHEKKKRKSHSHFDYFANPSKRWLIALLFGLIHGFGFSSVLKEIGLPKDGLIASLVSFNLGIEAGQLAIVAIVFPFVWKSREFKWHNKAVFWASVATACIGAFWFVQRAFF